MRQSLSLVGGDHGEVERVRVEKIQDACADVDGRDADAGNLEIEFGFQRRRRSIGAQHVPADQDFDDVAKSGDMRRDFGLAPHAQERQSLLGLERDPQRMRERELAAPGEVGRMKNRRTFGFRGAHGQRPSSLDRWGWLSSGELCGAGGKQLTYPRSPSAAIVERLICGAAGRRDNAVGYRVSSRGHPTIAPAASRWPNSGSCRPRRASNRTRSWSVSSGRLRWEG